MRTEAPAVGHVLFDGRPSWRLGGRAGGATFGDGDIQPAATLAAPTFPPSGSGRGFALLSAMRASEADHGRHPRWGVRYSCIIVRVSCWAVAIAGPHVAVTP